MDSQTDQVFDLARGELRDVLGTLKELVTGAPFVALEDGGQAMLATLESDGVRATASIEAASMGPKVVLALGDLEVTCRPRWGDAETRVTIARCPSGAGEVEVRVGRRSYRLEVEHRCPQLAQIGAAALWTSWADFVRPLRSVRRAARSARPVGPVVTVALTAAGLTFGAGSGENVTLDTAPVRDRSVTGDRVAVLPLAPLEAFVRRMPREDVRVSWPLGDEGWVTFSCGRLSLSLRQLAEPEVLALPGAVAARYGRPSVRGRVTADRARLIAKLLEEEDALRGMGVTATSIVLRVQQDGGLSAISPERRETVGFRLWQTVEMRGRHALWDVELHLDFEALLAVLRSREDDVTDPAEDLVTLHVFADAPVVVTLPRSAVDDVAVRRDAIACRATAGAWLAGGAR